MKRQRKRKGFAVIPKSKARAIQRMGGLALARNRKHMAMIGRIGGRA